jgi:hypothetical protein
MAVLPRRAWLTTNVETDCQRLLHDLSRQMLAQFVHELLKINRFLKKSDGADVYERVFEGTVLRSANDDYGDVTGRQVCLELLQNEVAAAIGKLIVEQDGISGLSNGRAEAV